MNCFFFLQTSSAWFVGMDQMTKVFHILSHNMYFHFSLLASTSIQSAYFILYIFCIEMTLKCILESIHHVCSKSDMYFLFCFSNNKREANECHTLILILNGKKRRKKKNCTTIMWNKAEKEKTHETRKKGTKMKKTTTTTNTTRLLAVLRIIYTIIYIMLFVFIYVVMVGYALFNGLLLYILALESLCLKCIFSFILLINSVRVYVSISTTLSLWF